MQVRDQRYAVMQKAKTTHHFYRQKLLELQVKLLSARKHTACTRGKTNYTPERASRLNWDSKNQRQSAARVNTSVYFENK